MEKQLSLPRLRPEMTSGVLCAWLKAEGETVRAGEPVYEIQVKKISKGLRNSNGNYRNVIY